MSMSNFECQEILRRAGYEDKFIKTRMSHVALGRTIEEATELCSDMYYPIALKLKHNLTLDGKGRIKTGIDLEELASKGDPTRDAIWVYDYLHFDDVCDFGHKPTYDKQPLAPSPTAYAIWRAYKYMDNGFKEFVNGFYKLYGPQKKDIELLQKNKDDGRHLIDLNKDIAQARRKSEELALQKLQN